MINVNIHQAKSNLSRLLTQVENGHEVVQICRNDKPIAWIIARPEIRNPLTMHSELQGVKFKYNPVEPLSEDDWPSEE